MRVRVGPGARRDRIIGRHDNALKVAVRSPAEKGRANAELIRVVAEALDLAPRDVEILRGSTSRDKVLLVSGMGELQLRSLVEALLVRLGAT